MKMFILAILTFAGAAAAAPFPVTSSSEFINSELGLFHSQNGFSVHAGETSWIHQAPPTENPYIATMYKSPAIENGVQAALTVRVDKLTKNQSLKKYVKKWMKDYPRLGFQVLGAKPVKINEKRAFMLDLVSQSNDKQLRQVILKRKKTVVILTCRDDRNNFSKTLKSCNQIVRNFDWH